MTDNADQSARMRDMWSAVVITAINDAIRHAAREPNKHKGRAQLWANSRNGREVISMAGIDPDKLVTDCMVAFAVKGVPLTQLRKMGVN